MESIAIKTYSIEDYLIVLELVKITLSFTDIYNKVFLDLDK
ncbi:hypothetical protein [Aphanothece sacrum]|nr:hypothetical protein [Aphanothece sacrum]